MSAYPRPQQSEQQQQPPGAHSSLAYGNAEDRKIFMGGLPQELDKEYIDAYFSQFGEIEDSIVMMDRVTGRSRGFGFITFLHPQDMETCLANSPHVLMEKVIDVKRAADGKKPYSSAGNAGPAPRRIDMLSHPTRAAGSGYNNIPSLEHRVDPSRLVDDPRKVFIGGIPVSGDKDKLIALLSRYGSVIDCDIMYDKETGRNKGYGRATYSTPAEANAAIRSGDANMIDAKCVEIKPLLRPPTNIPATPNTNRFNNHDDATGYTMDGPCKVFLGGIPPSVDEDKLAHHLSRYGRVAEVRIYRDMETGRHKGFGFAIMGDPSQAKAACHGGNNNYIDSKWIQVKPFCNPYDRNVSGPMERQMMMRTPGSRPPPPATTTTINQPPPPPPAGAGGGGVPATYGRGVHTPPHMQYNVPPLHQLQGDTHVYRSTPTTQQQANVMTVSSLRPQQGAMQSYPQQPQQGYGNEQAQQGQATGGRVASNNTMMSMQAYNDNPYIHHTQEQQQQQQQQLNNSGNRTPSQYMQHQHIGVPVSSPIQQQQQGVGHAASTMIPSQGPATMTTTNMPQQPQALPMVQGTSPAGPGAYNYQGSMAMTAASAAAAAQQQQLQQQAYNFMAAYQEAAAYNAAGRGQRTAPY